jgi:hypothetical protein
MTEDRRSLSAMAITDRTRKILWVKAGGRCSMCRALLVTEGTETDDPSVFGQEAHIVGRSPKGPRAADIPGIDSYANLILLCAKHHKQVDDQREHFTVELLNEIKGKHEEWTATLGETADRDPGPVRLIPDPSRPLKKLLKLIVSGTELWEFVDGALSFFPAYPDVLSDEHDDLISAFFDTIRDWIDISDDLSFSEKRKAGRSLNTTIDELAEAGFVVGVRDRPLLLTGGVSDVPSPWRAVDIQIHSFSEMQLAGAEGKPMKLDEVISKLVGASADRQGP